MLLNATHLTETVLLLLAAYLLGCVVGYGVRRVLHAARGTRSVAVTIVPMVTPAPAEIRRPRSPAARLAATVDRPVPAAKPVPRPVVEQALVAARPQPTKRLAKSGTPDPRPAALSAPRDGRSDNLKQIKGIGPKIEASLNSLGVYHFDQIAAWTKANVDWVDGHLAFKGRIRRERWVEQARDMAKADA